MNPMIERPSSFLPLSIPLLAAILIPITLIAIGEGWYESSLSSGVLDPTNWAITEAAATKDILLVMCLMFGDVVAFTVSAGMYAAQSWNINHSIAALASKTSLPEDSARGYSNWSPTIVFFAILFATGWLAFLILACISPEKVTSAFPGVHESSAVSSVLTISGWFALAVYFFLLVFDVVLVRNVRRLLKDLKRTGNIYGNPDYKKAMVAQRIGRSSIFIIHIPAIFAAIVVILISSEMSQLSHVVGQLGSRGEEVLSGLIENNGVEPIQVKMIVGQFRETFSLGLAAGLHVGQLFFSQFVFFVLVIQSQWRDRN